MLSNNANNNIKINENNNRKQIGEQRCPMLMILVLIREIRFLFCTMIL